MIFLNNLNKNISKTKYINKKDKIIHDFFEIGILLKGIDGLFQILGGFLLIFINPQRLNKVIVMITQHELSEDPNDVIASYMFSLGHTFSLSSQHFGVIYLISHGIIKIILYLLLLNNKKGAYPIAIISLITFIFYQMYRYIIGNSIFMLILTFIDIIMLILTFVEYKNIKNRIKN